MNLKELTNEIEMTTQVASRNLEEIPVNTRAGWGVMVEQAKNKLKTLKATYKNTLFQKGVGIFITGDKANVEKFANLVTSEKEGLVVDSEALYKRLSTHLEPTFSPMRKWGVAQTRKLTDSLMEIMHEVGLKEIPAPTHKLDVVLSSPAEVEDYVRKIVRDCCKDDLNATYLQQIAFEQALKIRYNGNVTPVVVLNAKEDELNNLNKLFSKGTVTLQINADDVIDKEFLTKTLGNVIKQLKKKESGEKHGK